MRERKHGRECGGASASASMDRDGDGGRRTQKSCVVSHAHVAHELQSLMSFDWLVKSLA